MPKQMLDLRNIKNLRFKQHLAIFFFSKALRLFVVEFMFCLFDSMAELRDYLWGRNWIRLHRMLIDIPK